MEKIFELRQWMKKHHTAFFCSLDSTKWGFSKLQPFFEKN